MTTIAAYIFCIDNIITTLKIRIMKKRKIRSSTETMKLLQEGSQKGQESFKGTHHCEQYLLYFRKKNTRENFEA